MILSIGILEIPIENLLPQSMSASNAKEGDAARSVSASNQKEDEAVQESSALEVRCSS